jgi:hypothetical protein
MPAEPEKEKPALDEAQDFLEATLGDGPVLVSELRKAAREAGITWITLRRAKDALTVSARRREVPETPSRTWPWEWFLGNHPHARTDEHLEPLE